MKKLRFYIVQSVTDMTPALRALCTNMETARKYAKTAEEKLVAENYRLIFSLAKIYQHQGLELEDLVSEGLAGLWIAAKEYDPARQSDRPEGQTVRFSYLAAICISQQIIIALRECGSQIRVPNHYSQLLQRLKKEQARFEQENEREPELDELAEILGTDERLLRDLLQSQGNYAELDSPIGEEDGSRMSDMLTDHTYPSAEDRLRKADAKVMADKLLQKVSQRKRKVMKLYYGIDCEQRSVESIAHEMKLTAARVRQLIHEAEKEMRISSRAR